MTALWLLQAPRPLIFAHRGFGDYGPDNSLYAMDHAIEAGLDGADLVCQLTSDGELVIFHDRTVDRLTSGTGKVADKTLSEMLALDLGPKYKPDLSGAHVRPFRDFVRSVNRRGAVLVELKAPGWAATGIEQRAVDIIRRYDANLSVILASYNPIVLRRVKQIDPLVRTAFMFTDTRPDDAPEVPWIFATGICPSRHSEVRAIRHGHHEPSGGRVRDQPSDPKGLAGGHMDPQH